MKISVIIPVYNSSKFLDMCLNSVIHQTYTDLEILLINDGSTDDSGKICDKYAAEDKRIRVIHKKNGGVSSARNRGLEIATGDLISFIDSDDQLEEDMYSFLVEIMEKNSVDISHCGYKRMDEEMNILKEISGSHKIYMQSGVEAIDCMLNGIYFSAGLWNKLFKNDLVKTLRFCEDLKNNEDILFNVQAFVKAEKTVFADETKYRYFEHKTSACNQINMLCQHQDSVIASERMLKINDARITGIIYRRYYESQMNLYRFLLLQKESISDIDVKKEKRKLALAYSRLDKKTFKCKVNYYMITSIPCVYRGVYRIYDIVRKPKWDAEGDK